MRIIQRLITLSSLCDIYCFVTAILFSICKLIEYIKFVNRNKRFQNFDSEGFLNFDPIYEQKDWQDIDKYSNTNIIFGFIYALTWFILLIPIVKVVYIQILNNNINKNKNGNNKHHYIGIHITIIALAFGGSITELLTRVMELGISTVSQWISEVFNLENWINNDSNDMIGWRVLGLVNFVTDGMLLWIDALEWLFLSGILILLFISIRCSNDNKNDILFNQKWAYLGLFIGMLCFIEFCGQSLQYTGSPYLHLFATYISGCNRLVLIPVWLLWLGKQLPEIEDIVTSHSMTNNIIHTTNRDHEIREDDINLNESMEDVYT